MSPDDLGNGPFGPISRRSAIGSAILAGAALFTPGALAATDVDATPQPAPARKRYDMKKSINLWAFPYPQKMTLTQCLQLAKDAGFDGIELNYDLESDLSPKSGTREFQEIRRTAERIGIADQRTVLVSLLAVSVDEQRRHEAQPRAGARRQHGAGGARPRDRESARRAGRRPHPVARRSRARPQRRLRSPGARGDWQPGEDRRRS